MAKFLLWQWLEQTKTIKVNWRRKLTLIRIISRGKPCWGYVWPLVCSPFLPDFGDDMKWTYSMVLKSS